MDDQRTDRKGGDSVSRDIETRRVQAVVMVLLGCFAILFGVWSLLRGPIAFGGVHSLYFGVTAIAMGMYRYPRAGK
jgi:uncharacterized membrane protein HdeD (DUF308 family)